MKTLTHKHNTARCKLSLPYFEAESKEESCAAKLMNRFTSKLEEKIISYANDIKHGIRTYTSDFNVDFENNITLVHIRLSARMLTSSGGIRLYKKELLCRWNGTKLLSVNSI